VGKEWHTDSRLQAAVLYATEQHGSQARKGTQTPYLVHPLSVCKLLLRYNSSTDLAIAGVLHDVIEDTPATAIEVAERFGGRVAELVVHASEPDKGADWRTRKQRTVDSAAQCQDMELIALKCADKLDNLQDIRFDYSVGGEEFWNRFNTPNGKPDQAWYYGILGQIFLSKLEGSQWEGLALSLQHEFEATFQV
jgi:(p)ppGpp synthase/HD superfamily hydrolase